MKKDWEGSTMDRRQWLVWTTSSVAGAPALAMPARPPSAATGLPRPGSLMVIGGAEDRRGDRLVLRRFVELCRQPQPRVVVLPSASAFPQIVAGRYEAVLNALGVQRVLVVHPETREEADDRLLAAQVATADGILMTGGDQGRLAEAVGGTALQRAIHHAYEQGACVAGTSAGAAVLSGRMLRARAVDDGFGLLPQVIIDQHFTERRRLPRLLRALSQHPDHVGVGVDEDTALVLRRGRGAEVVGSGGVTVVDPRAVQGPIGELAPEALMHLPGLRVYRLQAAAPVDPQVASLLMG
ncbi:cyanophycinase [Aquincola sp. J276]|uniref:cyanophycinase n=2 Tax=Aquincola TaxID=391952 RepID=UPI002151CCC4|nr:cyanophycinase [Aquincola sp. J276]MCR5868315.1 cyanophycinase [Aquincola sp. J276]